MRNRKATYHRLQAAMTRGCLTLTTESGQAHQSPANRWRHQNQ